MKYFVTLPSGREHQVDIKEDAAGKVSVKVDGQLVEATAEKSDLTSSGRGATAIRIGGRSVELWLEGAPPKLGVIADGQRFFAAVESERMRIRAAGKPAVGGGEGEIKSPMPGRVVRVLVKDGDEVESGVPVIVVEAMKMENELGASRAGKIKKVHVAVGATVESGTLLVEISDVDHGANA
jgi:biotin carboxyl carrier protein